MKIEKLIEQLQKSADFEDYPVVASFAAIIEKKYLREAATALEQLQAENANLHDELEKVDAERDAVIKELNGVSSLFDDLAEFVDREIHPVVDYNLYLDLRENVDAVSMFQHEDEWRGLHKEE